MKQNNFSYDFSLDNNIGLPMFFKNVTLQSQKVYTIFRVSLFICTIEKLLRDVNSSKLI